MRMEPIGFEAAYDFVAEMTVQEKQELPGVTAYSGVHPDRGRAIVVIPCLGDGLLCLPVVTLE